MLLKCKITETPENQSQREFLPCVNQTHDPTTGTRDFRLRMRSVSDSGPAKRQLGPGPGAAPESRGADGGTRSGAWACCPIRRGWGLGKVVGVELRDPRSLPGREKAGRGVSRVLGPDKSCLRRESGGFYANAFRTAASLGTTVGTAPGKSHLHLATPRTLRRATPSAARPTRAGRSITLNVTRRPRQHRLQAHLTAK